MYIIVTKFLDKSYHNKNELDLEKKIAPKKKKKITEG